MIPNVGPLEMIVVLAIALMIFGPKKLPEMGRSVGKGIREFKNSVSGDDAAEVEEEGFDVPVLDQKPTVAAASAATAAPVASAK